MKMFRCNECGHVFDEPETWNECRGEFWGVMSYETMAGCPECYSTDFEELKSNKLDLDDEEGNEDECDN